MRVQKLVCGILVVALVVGACHKRPYRNVRADLDWAAWNGNLAEVQALIARGASVNGGALHTAAAQGHKEVVELLVRCGARVDGINSKGRTPAIAAMQEDHRAIVEYLVGEGAVVNLHLAAYLGDVDKVKSLIDAGADVNAKDSNTWTPLLYAGSGGHWEVARALITAGADLNAKADGRSFARQFDCGTVLHCAVRGGHAELAELLLDRGVDREVRDKYGETPLEWAVRNGRLAMVQLLIAKGANPNSRAKENYFCSGTPLGIAIDHGYADIADALIVGGADVNARDEAGWTSLHVAVTSYYQPALEAAVPMKPPELSDAQTYRDQYNAMSKRTYAALVVQMTRVLIGHGAEVSAKDEEGITPLHCASYHGLRDAMQLLIAKGADVNAKSVRDPNPDDSIAWEGRDLGYRLSPGVTPLHEAAFSGDPCVVEMLLTHGARVEAADELGATALHYAAALGNADVVKVLIAKGADVNAADTTGAMPLLDALLRGHVKTAKVLIAAGAERVDVQQDSARDHAHGMYLQVQRPLLHEALRGYLAMRRRTDAADANEGDVRREWIELLLANGADPDERDDKGNTPLHGAILVGDEKLARLFVAQGTDVNARNQGNITALHYAANDGRMKLASLLLAKGADVNARDNDGDTPMHCAVRRGHAQVVEVLVAGGADIGIRNSRGYTPLEEAIRRKQ
jgi:ankyrin repeat protein